MVTCKRLYMHYIVPECWRAVGGVEPAAQLRARNAVGYCKADAQRKENLRLLPSVLLAIHSNGAWTKSGTQNSYIAYKIL